MKYSKVTFFLPLYSKVRKHKTGGRWKTFFVYLSREEVVKFEERYKCEIEELSNTDLANLEELAEGII